MTYASAMLRLRRENGGNEWVKAFFKHLATCPEADDRTESGAMRQCQTWFIAASLAAGKDLSPVFCDGWHLPLTESQRGSCRDTDWKSKDLTVSAVMKRLGLDAGAE